MGRLLTRYAVCDILHVVVEPSLHYTHRQYRCSYGALMMIMLFTVHR